MKRDPVFLTLQQREIAIEAFVASLRKCNIDVYLGRPLQMPPVEYAAHQKYTHDYIADHAARGAVVWLPAHTELDAGT